MKNGVRKEDGGPCCLNVRTLNGFFPPLYRSVILKRVCVKVFLIHGSIRKRRSRGFGHFWFVWAIHGLELGGLES